jgi:hypothetical protein
MGFGGLNCKGIKTKISILETKITFSRHSFLPLLKSHSDRLRKKNYLYAEFISHEIEHDSRVTQKDDYIRGEIP